MEDFDLNEILKEFDQELGLQTKTLLDNAKNSPLNQENKTEKDSHLVDEDSEVDLREFDLDLQNAGLDLEIKTDKQKTTANFGIMNSPNEKERNKSKDKNEFAGAKSTSFTQLFEKDLASYKKRNQPKKSTKRISSFDPLEDSRLIMQSFSTENNPAKSIHENEKVTFSNRNTPKILNIELPEKDFEFMKDLEVTESHSKRISRKISKFRKTVKMTQPKLKNETREEKLRRKTQQENLEQRIKQKSQFFKRLSKISPHFPVENGHCLQIPLDNGTEYYLEINRENCKHWYYIKSKSFRQYQFNTVQTCLFFNTLVSLPTGMGKTFIASNIILNFYKWYSIPNPQNKNNASKRNKKLKKKSRLSKRLEETKENFNLTHMGFGVPNIQSGGKLFFLAPTRPLVNQQMSSFKDIPGVSNSHISELTGSYPPKQREQFYKTHAIFFMTPQTLINDLENSLIDPEKVVLLILDEAHRATNKYAYCRIINFLEEKKVPYRVVALSATPGNTNDLVQQVISNLKIEKIVAYSLDSAELQQYQNRKQIDIIKVYENYEMRLILAKLKKAINQLLNRLNKKFEIGDELDED